MMEDAERMLYLHVPQSMENMVCILLVVPVVE